MKSVSIITPLFNKEPYVGETIRSVLAQTMQDWEMIVVDNGSTDHGPEVVRQFLDSRIALVDSPKRGPGAARNFGLGRATGEWILFLDADDLIEPDYLQERLAAAVRAPSAKIVAGPWQEFRDGEPEKRLEHFPAGWKKEPSVLQAAAFAFAPWILHAAMVRSDHLCRGPRWNEDLDDLPAEDCAFWFPLVHATPVAWCEDHGAIYRKNTRNSRDQSVTEVALGFRACVATVSSNESFLAGRGERATSQQAATVVRVLRRMLSRVGPDNETLRADLRREIRRWLRATSYADPRMLCWRIFFREPRLLFAERSLLG
jgi:glycosyltransferase involved in cell wall biosynthesis